jgi:hypothetical protein
MIVTGGIFAQARSSVMGVWVMNRRFERKVKERGSKDKSRERERKRINAVERLSFLHTIPSGLFSRSNGIYDSRALPSSRPRRGRDGDGDRLM